MIEDNYSRLNYIREERTVKQYDFIPSSRKKYIKGPKKPSKGGFLLFFVVAFVVVAGLSAKYAANTIIVSKAQKTNVASAEVSLGALGSDDSATLVVETKKKIAPKNYSLENSSLLPSVGSEAYLVGDVETGEIIFSKNTDVQYPIASVSKLMTAIVARDNLDLHKTTIVTKAALAAYGTTGSLIAGEKMLLTDLFYPLLMESSNDAAEVFAEVLPQGQFIDLMNKKAWELGMEKTSFKDPSGLTQYNISTPQDLFKLTSYIYKNEKDIYDIARIKEYSILKHSWVNHNHFLGYANFIGGKNGYTDEARRTTVSLFDIPVTEDETRTIAIVVLKTENREKDVKTILDFIKKNVVYLHSE